MVRGRASEGLRVNNPRLTIVIATLATLYFGYSIFFTRENLSPALATVNWAFFALGIFAIIGSAIKIAKGR